MKGLLSTIIAFVAFATILLAQGATLHYTPNLERIVSAQDLKTRRQESLKAQSSDSSRLSLTKPQTDQPTKRKVDVIADIVRPYNSGEDSVVYFLDNFAAHHNGAVITCDSAVRYGDSRMGFFSRVLINQDSIYIYGDSALYDGESGLAEIYSPIIKVVDGDAMLYTYNFSFNTIDKIGTYSGGGVLVHDNDIMESERGYYYANTHDIICVDNVELHGMDYDMKSDSAIYNTETKFARFFDNSEIWNLDGDYLSADEGYYDQSQNLYMVTRNGYVLSKEQEMWGDTISYYRGKEHIVARRNIQVDDFSHKILAFGDYAEYWSNPGNAVLTNNPSIVSYDLSQSDSVFMSADSVWLYTVEPKSERDSLAGDSVVDSPKMALREASEGVNDIQRGESTLHDEGAKSSSSATTSVEKRDRGETTPRAGRTSRAGRASRADKTSAEGDSAEEDKSSEIKSEPKADKGQNREGKHNTQVSYDAEPESVVDSGKVETKPSREEIVANRKRDKQRLANIRQSLNFDSLTPIIAQKREELIDSLKRDTTLTDKKRNSLIENAEKIVTKQIRQAHQDSIRKIEMAARKVILDSIAAVRQAKVNKELAAMLRRDSIYATRDSLRHAAKIEKQREKLVRRGKLPPDSIIADSIAHANALKEQREREQKEYYLGRGEFFTRDSITEANRLRDSIEQAEIAAKEAELMARGDSTYRMVKAYRNVKMYRSDAQMVCDSLVTLSLDSIIHLYIEPILWNNDNQISSNQMDIFTRNQQIERADFVEQPIMVSEVDKERYNQVAGKQMSAFFRGGEIYRNDVDGNVQTIYYQGEEQADGTMGDVTEMIYVESGTASFFIENKQLTGITYRNDVPFNLYPIEQIPEKQEQRLKNFKWAPELRPERNTIFQRVVRPSVREERRGRARPTFSIVEKMDRLKEQLMQSGVWYDREDELTPEVIEWRDTREM